MQRLICTCVAVILLVAVPAFAKTGNELKEWADQGEKYPKSWFTGLFEGYVLGVAETTSTKLCKPKGVTNKQICEVVTKYLKDHPEKLHLHAGRLVIDAIQTTWPCPK